MVLKRQAYKNSCAELYTLLTIQLIWPVSMQESKCLDQWFSKLLGAKLIHIYYALLLYTLIPLAVYEQREIKYNRDATQFRIRPMIFLLTDRTIMDKQYMGNGAGVLLELNLRAGGLFGNVHPFLTTK